MQILLLLLLIEQGSALGYLVIVARHNDSLLHIREVLVYFVELLPGKRDSFVVVFEFVRL